METDVLIKMLDNIDLKLNNSTYKEEKVFTTRFGETMTMPSFTKQRYSVDELSGMWDRKHSIIKELFDRGVVDEDGYKKYIFSNDPKFTPELIIK